MWAAPLRAIGVVLVLAVAAFGAGSGIADRLPRSFGRIDRFACAWLAGAGLISSVLFLIGQWRFTGIGILLVVLLSLLLAIRPVRKLFDSPPVRERIPRAPALIVASIVLIVGVAGLAEVVGDWNSDTVAYHLLGPKVWLREGVIRPVVANSHTAMPQTGETLYAVVMAFGGDRAPGFWNVLTLIILLLLAASIGMRCGLRPSDAWWVAALVATMPAVCIGAEGGFVDVLYAAFILAAIRVGFDADRSEAWAILGLFGGLAVATKYPGLLAFPAVLICALLVKYWEKLFDRSVLTRAGIGAAIACAVGAPYYIRNWLVVGCPIYPPPPVLWRFFHVKYMSPQAIAQFDAYIRLRGAGLGRGLPAFLMLPFNLTFHTSNFNGAGGIGMAALALGPFGLIAGRRNAFVRALALLSILLTALWFVTQQESRFLIHVYVIGAIFAVMGWRYAISVAPRYARPLAAFAVALSVVYGGFIIVRDRAPDARSVFSATAAGKRRRQAIPYLDSFNYLNRQPEVTRVLILDRSVPPYYSDKAFVKPIGQWDETLLPEVTNAASALLDLPKWNVSDVLDVESPIAPFQVKEGTKGLTLVFEAPGQRIYRVDPSP